MKRIKAAIEAWRRERDQKLFVRLYNDPKSGIHVVVARQAQAIATQHVMRWLDSQRLAHCRYCSTTRPLRKHGPDFLCEPHFTAIVSKPNGVAA